MNVKQGLKTLFIIAAVQFLVGSQVFADGLVGWWTFDEGKGETVADLSGHGHDGKVFGVTSWVDGYVGKGALKITGGGVKIADSELLRPPQVTVAMWVNFSGKQVPSARLFQKGNDNRETINIQGGEGGIGFSLASAPREGHGVNSDQRFDIGKWYHITGIYDGSEIRMYVNGKVANKRTVGSFVPYARVDEPLVIGNRPPDMARPFNGMVDDVRVYTRPLSETEVWELYAWKGGDVNYSALPNPADESGNIMPNSKLKWMKGVNAVSSIVYFGTDEAAVKNAKVSDPEYKTSTTKESFDPGQLEFDKDYFWRIDSVVNNAALPQPADISMAVTDGLVGWWKFDEGAGQKVADSSGHGHDGKVFGVTSWEKGYIGNGALKITNFQEGENITNGGVVIDDSPLLRPSRFTVAMWVQWSRDFRQKALNRLLQKGNDNNETFVIIGGGGADNRGNANNAVSFAIATETRGDVYNVTAPGTFEGGKWYHVAASYDGADMSLYVNGKIAGKNTIGEVKLIAVEGEPLVIASRPPNMDRGFDGVVDDVRMYNKALSAEDIRKLSLQKGGNANGVLKGEVWRFSSIAGQAENPTPCPTLKNVDTNIKLTWEASSLAKSHDVYFGDDLDKVANATKGSKAHKGTLGLGKEILDPGKLEEGKYYYWRVDENCAAGTAKGDVWTFRTKGGGLVIQVDLAVKTCDNSKLYPGLAKPGWTIWASPAWTDMYMHDYQVFPLKADGSFDPAGINGTGVTLWFTTGNEGQLGIGAKGICRDNLGGGGCPSGTAEGDPICNSWAYGVDWVGPYAGDLLLVIRGLPAGVYEMNSYHNFWEPCTQKTRNCLDCVCGMPPMPSVTANPLPERLVSLDANGVPLPGKQNYKAMLPVGTGKGVKSIQNAYNVAPQHVYKDSELVPSVIKFSTDGSDVLVIYQADRSEPLYPDCARKGREGARGILNAFELIQLGPTE